MDEDLKQVEQKRQTSTEREAEELQKEVVAAAQGAQDMAQVLHKPEIATLAGVVKQFLMAIPRCCYECVVYVAACKCCRSHRVVANKASSRSGSRVRAPTH